MIRCTGYNILGAHRELIHWDLSVAKQGLTEKNLNIKEKEAPRSNRHDPIGLWAWHYAQPGTALRLRRLLRQMSMENLL